MAVESKWHKFRYVLALTKGQKGKEVDAMGSTQQVKKAKKLSDVDSAQKIKTKRKAKVTGVSRKPKTTEDVKSISKYKEWKLLYTPYPFKTAGNNTSRMRGSRVSSSAEEKNSDNYKGLCRNCKKQKTCKLPKPEGGVWRCEDYE